ncbi:MAG: SurA N-terminal domain-containing protein [Sphingobacteriaceae bacterium]|nr:SurA N-terminal domain-containing protein [Sphingobacteriaceae bacterium]
MSVLESIRSRTGLLVGLVGLALAIFVLESLLGSGSTLFGSGNTSVGTIAGDNIDYTQYSNKVNEQINMVMQNNPNANVDDAMRSQINDIVWNQFISEKIVKPEYKKVGVSVSEDELYDLMMVHPHQMVLQQLTDKNTGRVHEVVGTPDGNLDLIKLQQWVNGMNPEAERFWMNLETGIAESRLAEKYATLIKKGLYVTNAEAKEVYIVQNRTMNVGFVMKRYASVSDSAVKVNDDDIQKYYKDHQYEFKSYETTRSIEYVSFDVVPSEQDMIDLEKDAQRVASEFKTKTAKEDSAYIAQESEGGQVTISDLNKQTMIIRDSSVYTDPAGTVYGPYNEGAYFKIYKLEKIKSIADSARVRHILVGLKNPRTNQDVPAPVAKRTADSLLTLIKEKKVTFDTLVKTISDDLGSVDKGGDYGWFDENKGFVKEFTNAGLEGTVGNISIVPTQFGYHIIEVLDVSKTRHTAYTVAQIFKLIAPSPETTKEYYKAASDFGGQNNTADLFEKAIEKQKLNKRLAENVKENDKSLPGLEGAKDLVKWVYAAAKGEVSPQVFEFKDKFVVAHLTGIREKGTLPLEEVKEEVTVKARQAKKAAEFVKEFTTKAAGATKLDDVATKLGIKIETSEKLNFAAFNVGTLGREDALVGTAAAMKPGSVSKPIVGDNGVFIVAVASIDDGPPATDYKQMKMQLEQALGGRSDYEVYNALRDKAGIEDHRAKFE